MLPRRVLSHRPKNKIIKIKIKIVILKTSKREHCCDEKRGVVRVGGPTADTADADSILLVAYASHQLELIDRTEKYDGGDDGNRIKNKKDKK